jgi:hypothetical protein
LLPSGPGGVGRLALRRTGTHVRPAQTTSLPQKSGPGEASAALTGAPAVAYGAAMAFAHLLLAGAVLTGPAAPERTSTEAELERLRRFLGLAASARLSVAASPALPEARPLRLFLAIGLDVRVRENLTRWVEEWNRKEGDKQGRLKVVADLAEAHVVLAREVDTDKARTTNQTFVTPGMTPPRSTGTTSTQRTTFTVLQAPVRSYVLSVVGPDDVRIVWRDVGLGLVEADDSTGRPLWDDFRKLLQKKK